MYKDFNIPEIKMNEEWSKFLKENYGFMEEVWKWELPRYFLTPNEALAKVLEAVPDTELKQNEYDALVLLVAEFALKLHEKAVALYQLELELVCSKMFLEINEFLENQHIPEEDSLT